MVVDEIRAHAARTPNAPALVLPDHVIDYGELSARTERLARVLAARGVGPERVCAIALAPGADAVVAMLAVLRAGGAFLTLDVTQPAPRLAAMAADARFLLSTNELAERLALPVPEPAVLLDRLANAPEADPPSVVDPRCLAYVSHTSGSTGAPNAVLVARQSLDSYLRFLVRDYRLGPATTAVQLAPLGYDASVRDTLAPLLAGGRLVLAPRARLMRADGFAATVTEFGVDTVLSTTPSFLNFLAGQPAVAAAVRGLRLVVTSGESLRPFLAAGGRGLIGGRLVNQYGPTECTMTSTRFAVPADPDTGSDLVGTPIDGVVVRLLDDALRPVAADAVGHVYLGGVGVARGYLGRPALTADRFLPDPLGPPGARLYRTGDLARWRGGELEYLGRSDRQIKIRGHRVDPAEIEGALLSCPGVTGAVVTTDTDERGRVHMVAHVTGGDAVGPDAGLRGQLAGVLPPHMLPRRFVRAERIPTTRTGKADRAALALEGSR